MARGSKKNTAQSNSAKGASTQRKKGKNDAEDRVALKDAPSRGRARARAVEEEVPFEEFDREPRIFDDRTKRDIAGVIVAVVAVVLFLAVVLQPSGFLTSALSSALHLSLGIGAYVLPFILVIVGASLIVRVDRADLPLRLGVGLAMLFFAFMSALSLLTPGASTNGAVLFDANVLASRGGYVGSGIAWALLQLFGEAVSIALLLGVALAGAVIIGFSLTGAFDSLREKGSQFNARLRAARDAEDDELPGIPYEAADENDNPYAALDENRPQVQVESPEARAPRREERGLLAGFGMTKKEREAAAAAKAAQEAQREVPPARIRRAEPVHVPRDLSRPRRASESLSTQLLEGRRPGQAPVPTVDTYWPAEYAFGAADDVVSAASNAAAGAAGVATGMGVAHAAEGARDALDAAEDEAITQLLGAKPASSRIKKQADCSSPEPSAKTRVLKAKREALPWEDEAETVDNALRADSNEGAAEKPMTRRLSDVAAAPGASKTRAAGSAKAKKIDNSAFNKEGETRGDFTLPAFGLIRHTEVATEADEAELRTLAAELQNTLEDFSIMAQVVGWVAGPTVTLFKVDLPSGVRVSRIMSLTDDIALALAAPGVRIFAPIPGTNHVGIEVPNRTRQNVLLGDVLKDAHGAPLEMAIGKDVEGHSIVVDLAKMPHLLIGGTTGSGKSVAINAMIMSILMRATPDEVRFIMIDPKRVEFTPYNGIPHLYVPVVTENKEAASALSWGVAEMERRLKVMSKAGVRNISQYNKKVESGQLDDEEKPEDEWPKKMPYIVIIIDELADLMMNVGKEVELSISRIAQLARAAGIHMIVATQRPSTNVVTGLIKANITNRIAFNVASGIDSRVILDTPGAENLIGLGDMLFSKPEWPKPQRLQGCFVSEEEIEAVVSHLKAQGEPEYHSEILQTNVISLGSSMPDGSGGSSSADDPLLWDAADIVVASGLGSTSNIQRKLSVGYSRAGRIMDMLEEKGVVGPPNGSKPRDVLVDEMELESLKAFEARDAAEDGF